MGLTPSMVHPGDLTHRARPPTPLDASAQIPAISDLPLQRPPGGVDPAVMDAATLTAPLSEVDSRRALHAARSAFNAALAQWVQDLLEARRLGVLDHTWQRSEDHALRCAA